MKRRLLMTLLAAALAVPAGIAPAQQQRRPAVQRDWTQTIVQTPEGGFRIGNPAAAIKVVEYFSLTCPHCAAFDAESAPRLIPNYVRSGRVSLEYRNYVLNGMDLAAAMLSRCAAPASYFPLNHALLASQEQWMGRLQGLNAAQRQQIEAATPLQRMQRVVQLGGIDAIAARHGLTAPRIQACLSNQAGLDRLMAIRDAADRLGVNGTPTFLINGRLVETNVWAGIEPLLRGR
jgi:protein-disulfide isomerase